MYNENTKKVDKIDNLWLYFFPIKEYSLDILR